MGAIIHDDVIYGGGGSEAIELTQAQYDALSYAEKHDDSKVYYITDGQGGGGNALKTYPLQAIITLDTPATTGSITNRSSCSAQSSWDIITVEQLQQAVLDCAQGYNLPYTQINFEDFNGNGYKYPTNFIFTGVELYDESNYIIQTVSSPTVLAFKYKISTNKVEFPFTRIASSTNNDGTFNFNSLTVKKVRVYGYIIC